jgi:hypothetical protein
VTRKNAIAEMLEALAVLLEPSKRVNQSIGFLSHDGNPYLEHAPKVKCKDGFEVSVQASHHHYCTPRNSFGPWSHVELGFPTARVPSLKEYRDGPGPDQGTVFGYVPIEKVAALLVRHGGFADLTQGE